MNSVRKIDIPKLKLVNEDVEVVFEIEATLNIENDEIREGYEEVKQKIYANNIQIDVLDERIDKLTSKADFLDNSVAVASGLITGLIDSLWVGSFSFQDGKAWSNESVNNFVMDKAKSKGYSGERLDGAIRFLENEFPIPTDNIFHGKDLGISAKSHHLDDLAHHPTPLGLIFSLISQFTKTGYFQNNQGQFLPISFDESSNSLIGDGLAAKFFAGTLNWFFHLVSDMSGSNKTAGVGMGIPGPIVSLVKEFSLIPGINKTGLSKNMHDAFVKNKFDLRAELAVLQQLGRQAVPVILNEVIVRVFYFLRRLRDELNNKKSIQKVDWKKTLPWKNRTIVRMLTIATGTFTLVDLADAAIRGALKSAGELTLFLSEMLLRVNFVGIGRFVIALSVDGFMEFQKNTARNERIALYSKQLHLMNAKVFYLNANVWQQAEEVDNTINEAYEMMTMNIDLFIKNWELNKQSLKNIGTFRDGISKHNSELISDINTILNNGTE